MTRVSQEHGAVAEADHAGLAATDALVVGRGYGDQREGEVGSGGERGRSRGGGRAAGQGGRAEGKRGGGGNGAKEIPPRWIKAWIHGGMGRLNEFWLDGGFATKRAEKVPLSDQSGPDRQ